MESWKDDERAMLRGMVMTLATCAYNDPKRLDRATIGDLLKISGVPEQLTDSDVGEALDKLTSTLRELGEQDS